MDSKDNNTIAWFIWGLLALLIKPFLPSLDVAMALARYQFTVSFYLTIKVQLQNNCWQIGSDEHNASHKVRTM